MKAIQGSRIGPRAGDLSISDGPSRAFSTRAWSHPYRKTERVSGVAAALDHWLLPSSSAGGPALLQGNLLQHGPGVSPACQLLQGVPLPVPVEEPVQPRLGRGIVVFETRQVECEAPVRSTLIYSLIGR